MIIWPLQWKGSRYELLDVNGRTITNGRLLTQGITELDVRGLESGVYQFGIVGTDMHVRIVVAR